MVSSKQNYNLYKENVFNKIAAKSTKTGTEYFKQFFNAAYDKHQRVFFTYRLAAILANIQHKVIENNTHHFTAFVGQGGTGKSTLAKQVLYTLDPRFKGINIAPDMDTLINNIETAPKYSAHLLDEPDEEMVLMSKKGRLLKAILGRIRQKNQFVGICATELTSIPSIIYNKLESIFYLPTPPQFYFWVNIPHKWSFPVQIIKRNYSKEGYSVFKHVLGYWHIHGHFTKESPLTPQEEAHYLKAKEKDLDEVFKRYKQQKEIDADLFNNTYIKNKVIDILLSIDGLTDKTIADKVGVSKTTIWRMRHNKSEGSSSEVLNTNITHVNVNNTISTPAENKNKKSKQNTNISSVPDDYRNIDSNKFKKAFKKLK